MKEYKGSPAHDSGLLAAAQAVEHEELGREDAVSLSRKKRRSHRLRSAEGPRGG